MKTAETLVKKDHPVTPDAENQKGANAHKKGEKQTENAAKSTEAAHNHASHATDTKKVATKQHTSKA
jgi:hypothetical protein